MARGARPTIPIRTCVGCRRRAPQVDLLRIVAKAGNGGFIAVPDRDERQAGRGAYLHPEPNCLQLADQRRALVRALHLNGPLDVELVAKALAGAGEQATQQDT